LQNVGNQGFVLQQGGTGHDVADLFCGATHVDINYLSTLVSIVTRSLRHHLGIGAGNLHGLGFALAVMVGTALGLGAAPQQ